MPKILRASPGAARQHARPHADPARLRDAASGLPLAVWLDLRNLTETSLRRQATDLNSVITSMRSFYGSNVVARVLASPGSDRRSRTTTRRSPARSRSRRRSRSSSAG